MLLALQHHHPCCLARGAGAATQGHDATPAALGASVVLNNLIDSAYGESSSTLSLAEREARKNLVTTLISGTTQALGGEAALANTAAAIEVENNSMGGMMSAGINLGIAMNPNLSVKEKADLYQVMAANELEMAALLGGLPCLVTRNLVYDLQALRQGETTLADIAQQRGVEYVTGTLVTAMTMTGLNLVYQQGKLVIAPMAQNIQHSVAIQQSKRLAYTALSKAGINLRPSTTPTGQVITQSTHIKVAGVSDKLAAGNSLSKAGQVAASPSASSSAVLKQPPKVTNKVPFRMDETTTAKSIGQLETANKVTNFNINDLINSAKKPINDQGLSVAARAWEKHAGRPGSIFEDLKGNPAQKNAAANKFVQEILNNKNKTCTNLSRGGIEYRLPDGRGVRYDTDGSFSGFLDPKRPM